ncbi:MAG: hypothetical protein CMJ32_11860 [Phycisphaerae bacterium]|nr:hypothetical protein [Phycisphaerae bacterium]
MNHRAFMLILACLMQVNMVACSSHTRSYPGFSKDQVWDAAVTASENPEYFDWYVMVNEVWVDSTGQRIEILRELRRDYAGPQTDAYRQDRHWKFTVTMDEDSSVPELRITCRVAALPARFVDESAHFFDEVAYLLGDPTPVVEEVKFQELQVPATSSGTPDQPPSDQVDIDSLHIEPGASEN